MCDPLTLVGTALTIGSSIANAAAQQQVAKARDSALAAERIRQRQFDQQADAINANARARYDDYGDKQAEKAKSLAEFFQDPKASTAPTAGEANVSAGTVMPTASSDVVTREIGRQAGQAREFTDQQAVSLGNLRSFADLLSDKSRLTARDAGSIAQIGGFKRGSSNVLPLELEAANQKGAGLRTFADILGGAGSVATMAGLNGGSLAKMFSTSAPTLSPAAYNGGATLYGAYNNAATTLRSGSNIYGIGR